MELFAAFLLVMLLMFMEHASRKRWRNLPAPWFCVPFLGHLEFLMHLGDPVGGVRKIYRQYSQNGICYTRFINQHNILVGDYNTFRYLCNHPNAQHRVTNFTGNLYKYISESRGQPGQVIYGVMHSQGEIWREQRKFTVKTLREFGFGRKSMEELVQDEFKKFSLFLDGAEDEFIDLRGHFNLPVINVLWQITVGEVFDYHDQRMIKIMRQLDVYVRNWGRPQVIFMVCIPWLGKLFPKIFGRNLDIQINKEIIDLMKESIENHLKTLDVKEPRDFIDSYLIEIAGTTAPDSSFYANNGYENLAATLTDLFQAGSETTSTTLSWGVLYLVYYHSVQQAMQEEIDRVVGNQDVTISHKHLLPYCQAVIYEIQRYSNMLPHGGNHKSSGDIEVNGIIIPADTFITPVYGEMFQGDHWKRGDQFLPERFIDEDGNLRRDEHLIPFGVGKRQCLGEQLAKAQLFLFLSGLVQKYSITLDPDHPGSEKLYIPGVTRSPIQYKVKLKHRK